MFTLAMIQMRVDFHQPEANLNRAAHLVAQAAADGAQLCILPECMDLGWGTPEALQLAQTIPGAVSQRLCQIARENGVWLVSGLTENVGDRVYNAALLISDQGEILLHHRKINVLTGVEDVYAIGDRLAVADTPFGRIGIDICAWRINREQSYKSKQRKVSKIKGFRLLIRSRQEAETHFAPYLLPTDSSPGLCRKTGGESSSFPCRQLTESGL